MISLLKSACCLCVVAFPIGCSRPDFERDGDRAYQISSSVQEATAAGALVEQLVAIPDQLVLQGRNFRVTDVWIERCLPDASVVAAKGRAHAFAVVLKMEPRAGAQLVATVKAEGRNFFNRNAGAQFFLPTTEIPAFLDIEMSELGGKETGVRLRLQRKVNLTSQPDM